MRLRRACASGCAVSFVRCEEGRQSDGLGNEIRPHQILSLVRAVAFVEQQVEHGQDGAQSIRKLRWTRHIDLDVPRPELPLRPDDPLRDRRLLRQEGPRNLADFESAGQLQRQSDLAFGGDRGVTAREDHAKDVVIQLVCKPRHTIAPACIRTSRLAGVHGRQPCLQRCMPAQCVKRVVVRNPEQPRCRIARNAVEWPSPKRSDERILHDVLREIDVRRTERPAPSATPGDRPGVERGDPRVAERLQAPSASCASTARISIAPP